jgi:hypothetical protein
VGRVFNSYSVFVGIQGFRGNVANTLGALGVSSVTVQPSGLFLVWRVLKCGLRFFGNRIDIERPGRGGGRVTPDSPLFDLTGEWNALTLTLF